MKRRKGWHRKKRRMRHDHWGQFQRTLYNCFIRMREESVKRENSFWSCIADILAEAEAERNAGLGPATDNEPPNG